jgi:hypothetical protein
MRSKDGAEGKTFWVRVGAAFENDKGMQIVLDALPLPDADGRCVLMLFEPKSRGETEPSGTPDRQPGRSTGGGTFSDMDDDIPFITGSPIFKRGDWPA